MATVMVILLLIQKLASCCKSNIQEKIVNIQSNQTLKEDISEMWKDHAANNTLMVMICITLALVFAICCYGCVKHNVTTIHRSMANENARVLYSANSDKEVKFRIPT